MSTFSTCSCRTGTQYLRHSYENSWTIRALADIYQGHYHLPSVDKLDYGATLNNTKMLDGRQNFPFNEGFYRGDY